jgi:hypothetical protein
MFRPSLLIGALVAAIGLVFIGQGVGFLRGSSFMVGDSRWAWIGSAMVLAGAVIGIIAWRRDHP